MTANYSDGCRIMHRRWRLEAHSSLFRSSEGSWGGVVFLDIKNQQIHHSEPRDFRYIHYRSVELGQEREYHLRIIAWEDQFEAYLDGIMVLQFIRDTTTTGRLGLFVDNGRVRFRKLNASSLCVE